MVAMSEAQIYVKGDLSRHVETAADRVAAEFDGFKPAESDSAAPEVNDNPAAPETGFTSLVTEDEDSNALESGDQYDFSDFS